MIFAILNIAILLVYARDSFTRNRTRGFLPIVAALATSLAVALFLNNFGNRLFLFLILSFAMIFAILPSYYAYRTRVLLIFLAVALAEFFYATYLFGALLYSFIQMFAIGTSYGIYYRNGLGVFNREQKRDNKKIETRRDLVHIILGVIIFTLFALLPLYTAIYITTILIFIGYIYNSALGKRKKSGLYKILSSFERDDSLYGLGALYLGIGMALLIGFIHNQHFLLIGITALFFADPIATIVGIRYNKLKLWYNKKKSVAGTSAFFLTVTLVGFPLIGVYSALFGLVLALVESLNAPVDDNIGIATAMVFAYIVFFYFFPH